MSRGQLLCPWRTNSTKLLKDKYIARPIYLSSFSRKENLSPEKTQVPKFGKIFKNHSNSPAKSLYSEVDTRHPLLHPQLHRGSPEMAGDYKQWSSMHVSIVPLEERKSQQQLPPRLPNHALAAVEKKFGLAIFPSPMHQKTAHWSTRPGDPRLMTGSFPFHGLEESPRLQDSFCSTQGFFLSSQS